DGRPEVAEFVEGDVLAEAFPDVVRGHAVGDNIGEIGGYVKEAASVNAFVVHERDVADAGADAGAEDAEPRVALLLEPTENATRVLHGLAIGLESKADVGADELIGALVTGDHAAVVVGHAHLDRGHAEPLNPFTETALAVPFGVPVGEDE